MRKSLLVLNGPNLNLLGRREPSVYGAGTYEDLCSLIRETAERLDVAVDIQQHNGEGAMVEAVHAAHGVHDAAVVNAGAYTHTSVALRDALLGVRLPFAEVHISNVYKREPFRHRSYLSDIAECVICGAGFSGYAMAMGWLARDRGV